MQNNPQVSVVMGVYNGANSLPRTIESILNQENVDFEFIVVNDGSKDDTGKILEAYAQQDSRMRVIHQENTGLTKALICGCAEAKGEFIARQDVGDISYPNRLALQLEELVQRTQAVFVSCGTRYVDPDYEILYEVRISEEELNEGLHPKSLENIKGPSHHGSVMFRRNFYHIVGGYRAEYKVAQDIDLWIRMAEKGKCLSIPDILYEAVIDPKSISSNKRKQQILAAQSSIDTAILRANNMSESSTLISLEQKLKQFAAKQMIPSFVSESNAWYFIGASALKYSKQRARKYWLKSLRCFPLHVKSWIRLLTNY
ncbi:glycosyltransferase family 2 protein [Pseudanabaena mucicola]|uniref:Glycosyltransferase family 2 protein n=1 Tax=Pseudanabaena mucicola FACHB-723 TaxID=2692860 RepID=A0ABR7ZSY5_9CYAN|nr:glycosyltransferase family 2 protein [Pseudanabaena mucicola]MBD2187088.1 glycosyltransferase family 2 protein [Pseudanabaena mucicola FACHB-723]